MSDSRDPHQLDEKFQGILTDYGKVGLVIDDAYEAEMRVARSIYGCNKLPDWWLVGDTLERGLSLLTQLRDAASRGIPGIAVIDRYLPTTSDRSPDRIPWDLGPVNSTADADERCRQMRKIVRELEDMRSIHLVLETSYPYNPDRRVQPGGSVAWRTRDSEYLYRLRARVGDEDLLTYGPSGFVSAPSSRAPRSAAGHATKRRSEEDQRSPVEGEWKAELWWKTLRALARDLRDAEGAWNRGEEAWEKYSTATPLILLTGAGASFKTNRLGRGMPPTRELLYDACKAVNNEHSRRNWGPKPESLAWRADDSGDLTPVQWLMAHFAHQTAEELDWRLESVFGRKANGLDAELLEDFRRAFREQLHRYDNGFPHHHWLLAQLPWTTIITSNFDSFHERAAANAAAGDRESEERQRILRLGSPLPDEELAEIEDLADPDSWEHLENIKGSKLKKQLDRRDYQKREALREIIGKLRRHRGLSKPYGSLLLPKSIGLGTEELGAGEKFGRSFGTCLDDTLELTAGGWLVVLGQAMVDPSIVDPVCKVFDRRIKVLWIAPEALKRTLRIRDDHSPRRSEWDRKMRELFDDHRAGPLPAKAHEFAYDLWKVFTALAGAR